MANKNEKNPGSAPGKFYVDSACIGCGLCTGELPSVFSMNADGATAFVAKQPEADSAVQAAEDLIASCPVGAIGNDG
jgi:ferredoxin